MVTWLAGNRIRGTSTERTSSTGFNPVDAVSGGWTELARTTLGSAGDTITVSSLPDKRYYMLLRNNFHSGAVRTGLRLGNSTIDTGTNYANRRSHNGATDGNNVNLNRIVGDEDGSVIDFNVEYLANLSGKEKLLIRHQVQQQTAGAGNAPKRLEMVAKWANTSNPIDTIQSINTESGDFDTGSEIVVLGWDPADTHTTNFWEELASVDLSGGAADLIDSGTFTAKKYLWIQLYVSTTGGAVSQRLTFNSDTGSNYAQRRSADGGTDATGINGVNIDAFNDDMVTNSGGVSNFFIVNNSANEKLGIVNALSQEAAGAGTAPTRDEGVLKWANTSSQITRLTFTNNKAGDMDTGSFLKVWGSN
jgi:hypothetical protein